MQYLPRRQPFFVPFEHWTSWEPDDRITFLAAHLNDSPGNLCPCWDWSKFAVRQLQWDTYFKPIWSNIFYFNVYGQMKKSITRSCLNSLSLKERWCTRETIHNIDKRQNIDRATRKRGRERQERLCLPNSTSDVFWILLSWDLHLSIHSICFSFQNKDCHILLSLLLFSFSSTKKFNLQEIFSFCPFPKSFFLFDRQRDFRGAILSMFVL